MPCKKKSNGKWGIGTGPGVFPTKEKCDEAQAAIHARQSSRGESVEINRKDKE